jgi:hypothetical protein
LFKEITKTKESTHVPVKSEMHACVLLWFHGYCSQIVCSCCTDSQSILLHKHSSKTEEKNWTLRDHNAPEHAAFSVAQFLTSEWITVSRSLLTHLISHLATSFYFKK